MPYIGNTIRAADDYRLIDDISSGFDGSEVSFALRVAGSAPVPFPKSPQQVLISVNGVIQEPDPTGASGFNLSGTNIVFSSAPANGHAFFGIIYATADYLNAGGNFPAGSLGAPSITFIGDENSGLYRKSGGSVGFVSDATEIANFDSNGITISSGSLIIPDSITHGGDANTKIRFNQADNISFETAGAQRLLIADGGLVINEGSADFDVRIEGGNDANLFVTDAGNNRVGIGIAAPTSKLYVNGVSTDHIITARASDTNGNSIVNILAEGTTGNSRILFSDTAANDGIISYSHTDRGFHFGTAGTSTDMMLNSGGDLLLGTTADTILANFNTNAGGVLLDDINSGATAYGVTHGTRQLFLGCDTAHNYLWGYSNDNLYIGTNNAARISILADGRVGIGNAGLSPHTALHVENSSGDTYLKIKRASKSTGQTALDIDGGTSGVRYIIHQPTNEDNLNFYITGINATKLIYGSDGRIGMGGSPGTGQQLLISGNGLGITGQNVSHVASCVTIGEEGSGVAQIRAYGSDTSTYGQLDFNLSASDGAGSNNIISIKRQGVSGSTIFIPSGGGISFAATGDGAGTMQSEVLDDYEEGTWTPGTSIGANTTVHSAHYVKSGDMVMVQFYVNLPTSSSSSLVQINGLPYTVAGSGHYAIGACYVQFAGTNHVFLQTGPATTTINLYQGAGTGFTYASASNNYLLGTVVYRSS